jgi:cytochrome c oxidase subunit IV
MHARL